MRNLKFIAAIAVATTFASAASARTLYKIDSVVALPGAAPSWDYITVDESRNILFLGRRRAGVTVFDAAANRVVTTIENSSGANSAVLVRDFNRGYTINGDGTTTIFALDTLKTIDRVKVGASADNGFYDPVTKQLVVTMGDDKLLAFLDAKSGKLLGTLPVNAEELEGAATDGKGNLLIAERDLNKVARIDIAARKVVAEYDAKGCTQPTGVAYDEGSQRLFLGCKGEMPVLLVMDAADGRVVAKEPIGRGNDGVVFDATAKRVFATGGIDGNLVIYDQITTDKYQLAQALTTRPIARTIGFDPKTKTVFTMTAEGFVDPTKKRNLRAGAFYPNTFFDNTFTLLEIKPFDAPTKAANK